jgi:hypothetical protein
LLSGDVDGLGERLGAVKDAEEQRPVIGLDLAGHLLDVVRLRRAIELGPLQHERPSRPRRLPHDESGVSRRSGRFSVLLLSMVGVAYTLGPCDVTRREARRFSGVLGAALSLLGGCGGGVVAPELEDG